VLLSGSCRVLEGVATITMCRHLQEAQMFEKLDVTTTGNDQPPGEGQEKRGNAPRLITPQELALMCQVQRAGRGWTQETLAEFSGLQVRTIQRVEAGHPSNLDTKRALARAFEADDLDVFNKPHVFPTIEELVAKAETDRQTFERDNIRVAAHQADGRRLIRLLAECGAILVEAAEGVLQGREAEREWAGFADELRDWIDIADEIGEVNKLDAAEGLDDRLRQLGCFGVSVSVATRNLVMGEGERALRYKALYVVGMAKGRETAEIVVSRQVRMG
jgi:DNA-binding XRE family transcriptional regulator